MFKTLNDLHLASDATSLTVLPIFVRSKQYFVWVNYFVFIYFVAGTNLLGNVFSSKVSVENVTVDTSSFLLDINENGSPDLLEDFDGDGEIEALSSLDEEDNLVLWTDYDKDNKPDGFVDFDKNGIADFLEDKNSNSIPDILEAIPDGGVVNGVPSFVKRHYPSLLRSETHPNQRVGYVQARFKVDWDSIDFAQSNYGWVWSVVKDSTSDEDLLDGTRIGPETLTSLVVDDLPVGLNWFSLAPLDAEGNVVLQSAQHYAVEVSFPEVNLTSSSHPNPESKYTNTEFSVVIEESGHTNVFSGWLWQVSESKDPPLEWKSTHWIPSDINALTTNEFSPGENWLHLIPVDLRGNRLYDKHFHYKFFVDIPDVSLTSTSHPDSNEWYAVSDFTVHWSSSVSDFLIGGWLWRISERDESIEDFRWDDGTFEETDVDHVHTQNFSHGRNFFYLVPIDSEGSVLRDKATKLQFNAIKMPPVVTSSSHPNEDLAYRDTHVYLEWNLPDVPGSAVQGYRYIWNRYPTDYPDFRSSLTKNNFLRFAGQRQGSVYLHVVAVDNFGNLTEPSHFRANIFEITGQPAGSGALPMPRFSLDAVEGFAPFRVTFFDETADGEYMSTWDFNGDGFTDRTNPQGPITHVFKDPGVYYVSLTVSDFQNKDSRNFKKQVSVHSFDYDDMTLSLNTNNSARLHLIRPTRSGLLNEELWYTTDGLNWTVFEENALEYEKRMSDGRYQFRLDVPFGEYDRMILFRTVIE